MAETDLASKKCVPCTAGTPKLWGYQLEHYAKQVPGWTVVDEHHLERGFKFPDFAGALAFVNRIGAIAERGRLRARRQDRQGAAGEPDGALSARRHGAEGSSGAALPLARWPCRPSTLRATRRARPPSRRSIDGLSRRLPGRRPGGESLSAEPRPEAQPTDAKAPPRRHQAAPGRTSESRQPARTSRKVLPARLGRHGSPRRPVLRAA